MWGLEELKIRREIVDRLDWEMTPEKAVETYLEWGTGWTRKDDFVRYPGQEALYFVIYDWEKPAQVTLIRRTMKEAMKSQRFLCRPRWSAERLTRLDISPELEFTPLPRNWRNG